MPGPLYTLAAFRAGLTAARLLPRRLAQHLAPRVGAHLVRRNPAGWQALRENLARVTGLEAAELDDLCARNVANFSRMLADYFYCLCRPAEANTRLLQHWEGFDHLTTARRAGQGTILLTGHLGHWEMGGAILRQRGFPMTVITLDEPTTSLTAWREDYRRRLGIETITVGPRHEFAFIEMMKVLKGNGCLAMLVDRPYEGTGSPVDFFGQPAEFSNAPALLWQHTGAALIPAFVTREPGGRYRARAGPPLAFSAAGGTRAAMRINTQTVASAFESVIRDYPDQWYNYVPIWQTSPA